MWATYSGTPYGPSCRGSCANKAWEAHKDMLSHFIEEEDNLDSNCWECGGKSSGDDQLCAWCDEKARREERNFERSLRDDS